ncbi:MAG: hypothetical protein HN368_05320 [Spirochaetales bacterium]|nr:hypothetical protein [Spirochaetales bacterium]
MAESLGLDPGLFDFDRPSNRGIYRAAGDSKVDAVTTGAYPGMQATDNEYRNQLPEHTGPASLPKEVSEKAVMIYEWDACRTYNNVIMYPAMARKWRSMRAQICCQFQYSDNLTGPYNDDWGHHFLNYELTPAKSAAFTIASRLFKEWPLGANYDIPGDGFITDTTAVSFEHRQVLYAKKTEVIHAQGIEGWQPLRLPKIPSLLIGRHCSLFAGYTGSGIYRLEFISDGVYRLSVSRNTVLIEGAPDTIFTDGKIGEIPVVALKSETEKFELKLSGWDSFSCADENGTEIAVDNRSFSVSPGAVYLIARILKN